MEDYSYRSKGHLKWFESKLESCRKSVRRNALELHLKFRIMKKQSNTVSTKSLPASIEATLKLITQQTNKQTKSLPTKHCHGTACLTKYHGMDILALDNESNNFQRS